MKIRLAILVFVALVLGATNYILYFKPEVAMPYFRILSAHIYEPWIQYIGPPQYLRDEE